MRLSALTALLALAAATMAPAASLRTGDGLRLELSAAGRVTALSCGATALPLRGEGGFALADFQHQPEPVNLVPNPGFEEGLKGFAIDGSGSLDTAVVHSGKASLRLTVAGPQPGRANAQVVIPVKPSTHYRVGLWHRRHECPTRSGGAPGAYSSELDEQGGHVGVYQVGGRVPQQDDLWTQVMWEVTTRPDTRQLLLRGDIFQTTGTVWLDDFFICEDTGGSYDRVNGTVRAAEGGVEFTGRLPERGLNLQATLRGDRECLRIDGVVSDTTGEDRAVGVKFALPLDLAGWRWYDDAEDRATISAGGAYEHGFACEAGPGRCSTYPWSAVSGPQVGLSLALPLSQGPRVFTISHRQDTPELALTFFFGLSARADRNRSRAPFSFVLYSHDPAWGMRSAMARYYRLFPESFVKRPRYEGYLNYANLEPFLPATHELKVGDALLPDASDFGEGYQFVWHLHGCYDYHQVASDDPKMPTDETVRAWLARQVEEEKAKGPGYYTPTAETLKKIVYDSNGHFRYIFDTQYWRVHEGYNSTDKPGWGLNFRVSEDPGLSGFLAARTRQEVEKFAAAHPDRQPYDACYTADAIEGYSGLESGLDYRAEHLASTTLPLTFGAASLKPAIPNTIYDFHQQVWRPLTEQYQVITYGNGNVESCFFTMPFTDLAMVEGRWPEARRAQEERFWRATAYHKLWRYWVDHTGWYRTPADRASVERQLRHGLAGAIFPAVEAVQASSRDLDSYRALYRQHVPALEELSAAGWEPVPYATAAGAVVERFGSFTDGSLHLTLRSYSKTAQDVVLALDRQGAGIAAAEQLFCTDLLPGSPVLDSFPAAGLPVHLEADGTRAFWVGTQRQAALRGFRLALYTLGKIERLFATELDAGSRQVLAEARGLAGAAGGNRQEQLARSERLQAALERLPGALQTRSPCDLAKLILQARAQVSLVPAALLGLRLQAPRLVADALPGQQVEVACTVPAAPAGTVSFLSPWPEVAARCRAGEDGRVSLAVPDQPARQLLPYLVVFRGRAADGPFTLATPIDVTLGQAVQVALDPAQVVRGGANALRLVATNRLEEPVRVSVALQPTRLVKVTPAQLTIDLPARGQAQGDITLDVEAAAPLGTLWLRYTVAGDQAKVAGSGAVSARVSAEAK